MKKLNLYYFLFAFLLLNIDGQLLSAQNNFIIGQDLSYANMMEDCGADFKEDGSVKDVYQIFADNGTDLIRVRLWHNPNWQQDLEQPAGVKGQYNDFEDAKETIFRAKMAGMKVMLGFHFSDFWCDPGRQIVPKAWEDVASNTTLLADSVYNYVYRTLAKLEDEDLMPEYVKIGNENNSGIMTFTGMDSEYHGRNRVSDSWSRHAVLYNAAIKAVRDISAETAIQPQIALHVADPDRTSWFYSNLISNGVTDFDIMGFTYYYAYHGQSPSQVGQTISMLKNQHSGYEAMVVETGYLWDTENIDNLGNIITGSHPDYEPVSPSNQQRFMVDLSKAVYNNGGLGVIFWEPAWVSTPCRTPWGTGSSQEHVAFFDHRNNLNFMKDGGGGWPRAFSEGGTTTQVKVTFNVDMTGQSYSSGVFIVGQMTNWEFVRMQNIGDGIHQTAFELNPGDVFAYYYITDDSWDNYEEYRETVPEECAKSDELLNDPEWATDRAFVVPEQDTVINNIWSSCETFMTGNSLFTKPVQLNVFPNPNFGEQLTIEYENIALSNVQLQLLNTLGQNCNPCFVVLNKNQLAIETDQLKKGLYVLTVNAFDQFYSQKILIQ